ncbi:MAG: FG-GAP repeat protein [Myxococcota bacterium]
MIAFRYIIGLTLAIGLACSPAGGVDSAKPPETEGTPTDQGNREKSDSDGDGFLPPTDCDDDDPAISPIAFDQPGNGKDENCDGMDAPVIPWISVESATGSWVSSRPGDEYASALEVGDRDDDGQLDIVISAPAGMQIYSLPGRVLSFPLEAGTHSETDATLTLTQSVGTFGMGYSVALRVGTLQGEGDAALVISDPFSGVGGRAFIVPGNQGQSTDIAEAATVTIRSGPDERIFGNVLNSADLDGDGRSELILGRGDPADIGRIYIWRAPVLADAISTDASVIWTARDVGTRLGVFADATGDLTGNGTVDLVVGASGHPDGGKVFIVPSPLEVGGGGSDRAAATISGSPNDSTGNAFVVKDLNGDALDDIAIGSWLRNVAGPRSGVVSIFFGPISGEKSLEDADVSIRPLQGLEFMGRALAVTDFDGDGFNDLAVGAPRDPFLIGGAPGRVLLFRGPLSKDLTTADAALEIRGVTVSGNTGSALVGGFDMNSDGAEDLLVGAPLGVAPESGTFGAAYWVEGRPFDKLRLNR